MDEFEDRGDAGRRLAHALREYAAVDPLVLALPRGGVPVAYEVARALGAELDVWVVRKLGVPWHAELGMGAVAEGGHVHVNAALVRELEIPDAELERIVERERAEVAARVRRFRGDRAAPDPRGRVVILVDDGIATGGTALAALRSIRAARPRELVLAVPVAAPETLRALALEVDRVVCLRAPADLVAIGAWYADFEQVPDAEVVRLLEGARRWRAPAASADRRRPAR